MTDFPYPLSITKTDFRSFDTSQIDDFLYSSHRFTSLESLSSDLSKLSKDLNQTLLDLVNNDYEDYIRLGKSINEGSAYIKCISDDLGSFRADLVSLQGKLGESTAYVDQQLAKRKELLYIKTLAKVNLVLNDQVTSFEDALLLEDSERKLETLIGLYLSIVHLYRFLQRSPHKNIFTTKFLTAKVSSLRYEFQAWINGQKGEGNTAMMLIKAKRILNDTINA